MDDTPVAAQRDQDVVERLRGGDVQGAFELLARRYEARVFRLCCALLRDPAAAQDVAQDSLVRVWRALPRYDGRAALGTWIYAITRNRCLSALEQPPAALSLSDLGVQAEAEAVPQPDGDAAAADAQVLRRLVDELPERLRRAVCLYYFEERSLAEVAIMLGQPQGTTKTHLFRARAALLQRLQALGLGAARDWLGATPGAPS